MTSAAWVGKSFQFNHDLRIKKDFMNI